LGVLLIAHEASMTNPSGDRSTTEARPETLIVSGWIARLESDRDPGAGRRRRARARLAAPLAARPPARPAGSCRSLEILARS
jgi:hypothetical protein